MACGIYSITNNINSKRYIGKSKDIFERWQLHIEELNRNTHYNKYLQRAWNKYGMVRFTFEILRKDEIVNLNQLEKDFIYIFQSNNSKYGYNGTEGGDGGSLFKGYKHSEESKQKMSKSHKNISEETKQKISKSQKIRLSLIPKELRSRKHTEETKNKIRLGRLGKKVSKETILKRNRTRQINIRKNKGAEYDM